MLFPRTIRLDESDTQVFESAAEPLEWAISGSFHFLSDDEATLTGRRLQAFRAGFLGTRSFGWSTFVMVANITEVEAQEVETRLARYFVEQFGAPDLRAATTVAREEVRNASALCEHPVGTLLALERDLGEQGVIERFRQVPAGTDHGALKLWQMVADQTAPR